MRLFNLMAAGMIASTGLVSGQSWCCDQDMTQNGGIFVEGDALIWQPAVHGIPFGITDYTNGTSLADVSKVAVVPNKLNFKWNAGFRVGVGYQFPCAGAASLEWTHYNSTARGCSLVPPTVLGGFQSIWGLQNTLPISPIGTETSAFARWKLDLNLVDLKFGLNVSQKGFTVNPFAAVRAGWIQHRYNILVTDTTAGVAPKVQNIHMRSRFVGVGLRAGVEADYTVCGGFGVYGFGSGSLLYGRYQNCAREFLTDIVVDAIDISIDIPNVTARLRDRYNESQFIADCGAGVQWKTNLCNDSYALTLQVGWEQNIFFDQVQFPHLPSISFAPNPQGEHHNLTLQGVTFTAKLDF